MIEKEKLGQEPAFPELTTEYDGQGRILPYSINGMSKRFYAACAAMQGLCASDLVGVGTFDFKTSGDSRVRLITKAAYKIADELLKQEND